MKRVQKGWNYIKSELLCIVNLCFCSFYADFKIKWRMSGGCCNEAKSNCFCKESAKNNCFVKNVTVYGLNVLKITVFEIAIFGKCDKNRDFMSEKCDKNKEFGSEKVPK